MLPVAAGPCPALPHAHAAPARAQRAPSCVSHCLFDLIFFSFLIVFLLFFPSYLSFVPSFLEGSPEGGLCLGDWRRRGLRAGPGLPSPRHAKPRPRRAYLRPLLPRGALPCLQTAGQVLAHVGRGGQRPPQLAGLVGQGAAQGVRGGPRPLLLRHPPPQQGQLLLLLLAPRPRPAHQPLRLLLLRCQLLRQPLDFLTGDGEAVTSGEARPRRVSRSRSSRLPPSLGSGHAESAATPTAHVPGKPPASPARALQGERPRGPAPHWACGLA